MALYTFVAGCSSLPTRERGLKVYFPVSVYAIHSSLPTRERGLKEYIDIAMCN